LQILFVLPLLFGLYYLLRGRQDLVFLNVYLPCVILLPPYYAVRIPHLPPESAASWALFPLGVSLLFYPIPHLRLRRMDLWVTLFALSLAASELLREPSPKDGANMFAARVTQVFLAYVVGRRLIEPNLRVATMQRLVLLVVCLTPFILFEYRMAQNPWVRMATGVFHLDIGSFVQMRDGHARVQASFGHAIIAGIVFFTVFLLNCSLARLYKRDRNRLGPVIGWLERYHLPALLMVLFLWLTQSRGPMLGAVTGYSILQIPRFRHLKVAAFTVILVLAVAGAGIYSFFNKYTNAVDDGSLSEAQTSAMYRRDLLKNYEPIVDEGGWLGWGALNIPHVEGQLSIDNAYLLLELSQGKLGICLFIVIIAEGLGTTAYRAFSFHSPEARFLAFTLLGAMLGIFLSLYTVYEGPPVGAICFLLLGWSQSIEDDVSGAPKFYFRRVFA